MIYYKGFDEVTDYNTAYVTDINLEYGVIYVRQNIFGEDIVYKTDIEDVKKVD